MRSGTIACLTGVILCQQLAVLPAAGWGFALLPLLFFAVKVKTPHPLCLAGGLRASLGFGPWALGP